MEFDTDKYTPIIDELFQQTDLVTVSSKRIRRGLQEKLGYDISSQKKEVDALIAERFDVALAEEEARKDKKKAYKHEAPDNDNDASSPIKNENGYDDSSSPVRDNRRGRKTSIDEDARLAAKLQAEWNNAERPSRAGTKRKTPTPRRKKLKSKAMVGASDDSATETGERRKKRKINKNNPFHAPMMLSQPLVDLLGETQLSRPETVKQIWRYIKDNSLQDPTDKRYIVCNDPLKSIFKTDKVHMFTMNKILSTQLYPIEKPDVKKDESVSSDETTQNGMIEEAEAFM